MASRHTPMTIRSFIKLAANTKPQLTVDGAGTCLLLAILGSTRAFVFAVLVVLVAFNAELKGCPRLCFVPDIVPNRVPEFALACSCLGCLPKKNPPAISTANRSTKVGRVLALQQKVVLTDSCTLEPERSGSCIAG